MDNLRKLIQIIEATNSSPAGEPIEVPDQDTQAGSPTPPGNPPVSIPIEPTAANTTVGNNPNAATTQTDKPPVDPKLSQSPPESGGPVMGQQPSGVPEFDQMFPQLAGIAKDAQAGSPTAPAKTATKATFKDLGKQYGYNSAAEVKQIQQQLASMGYPIKADGKFGPQTQAAYQQAYSQIYGEKPGQPAAQTTIGEPPLGQTAAYPPVSSTAPIQPKTTDPNSPFYIPPNPAVEKYKAQQAQPKGVTTFSESAELARVITLANLNKN